MNSLFLSLTWSGAEGSLEAVAAAAVKKATSRPWWEPGDDSLQDAGDGGNADNTAEQLLQQPGGVSVYEALEGAWSALDRFGGT